MLGSENLYLIGPMGSGKTAVGKQLAQMLNCPFVDSDREIELVTGADIPRIFELEGEPGFRRRERETIAQLVQRDRIVLATGGGAVLDVATRESLKARGWVAYLETSVAQQTQRSTRTRQRPLLFGFDPAERLTQLMAVREPFYRDTADFITQTDRQRVTSVATAVFNAFNAARAAVLASVWCKHSTLHRATASRIFDVLMANRFARDCSVLALGGGVVGDMSRLLAACYQRGVPYFQFPTMLLAEVDSSVGGKTALNHPGGKNMIGAFYQLRAVFADVELLATLPEREHGDRALLNFGDTFGHAIEAATYYTEWLHGEAVGAGMRIEKVLSAAGIDCPAPQCGVRTAFDFMGVDKKVQAGRIRLVLLQKIGQAFVTGDYDAAVLEATLRAHFG